MTQVLDSYCLSVILHGDDGASTTLYTVCVMQHAQRGPRLWPRTGLYDFVGPCNIPLYCGDTQHKKMEAEVWEHRVQIEWTHLNRVNWHLPANTKGGCLRSAGLIYQTEGGGGALPRRTHEILTQFYMTLVLALASSFILETRRGDDFLTTDFTSTTSYRSLILSFLVLFHLFIPSFFALKLLTCRTMPRE